MNKWEDSQGLFVPNRQLSCIVAGLLFLFFCVFMTGYFLGKKNAAEQYVARIQQEACADHIYTTVLSATQESEQQATSTLLVTEQNIVDMPFQSADQVVSAELEIDAQQEIISSTRYYAQLIGFGTEKAAQQFVKKLASKGIETEIKKRMSKTVKGRTCCWYQVVTAAYSNKNDLSELVERIAKEEKIKDANICVC